MRLSDKFIRRALSVVLCLILLVSTTAFAVVTGAAEADAGLAQTGANTYYLWGENSNSPNFNSNTPTGAFTYDSAKGYYYYDLAGSRGDYCFVISTINNSANYAVKTPAVQKVANGGSYYLQAGNYHGFNCLHLWNPTGDAIRIYFTSASAGVNAVKAGSESAEPTTPAPTTPKPTTVTPTTVTPTTVKPTTVSPTTAPGTKNYVYCDNEAGWSTVYAYMWNSDSDKNKAWPGVTMTNIGGSVWRYEMPKTYKNIIFNVGSDSTKTGDMVLPGAGYVYNNKTGDWEVYDTSPLQVSSYATDLQSPQYDGVGVTLSAAAEGEGTVYYKFSVKSGSTTTVLSDFSTRNSVPWVPASAGTYTLVYDFRDAKGNTNRRTKTYVIESGTSVEAPYIKTVSPAGGEVKTSVSTKFTVSAGGGKTGTNLLFYKYTVKNAAGNIVNTPYYTRNTSYSYTFTSAGTYTVTVSVQASDNKTVERDYTFSVVGSLTPTQAIETQGNVPTQSPTQATPTPTTPAPTQKPTTPAPTTPAPTQKPTEGSGAKILKGDADEDEDISVNDATFIQRYDVGIPTPWPINLENADVNYDGEVDISDATWIQRFIVGIITAFSPDLS